MLITILVAIIITISFFVGFYLLSHLHKTLFNMEVDQIPRLKTIVLFGGISLIVISFIGIIALLIQNDIFILAVLIIDTIAATVIQMLIMNIFNQQNF